MQRSPSEWALLCGREGEQERPEEQNDQARVSGWPLEECVWDCGCVHACWAAVCLGGRFVWGLSGESCSLNVAERVHGHVYVCV